MIKARPNLNGNTPRDFIDVAVKMNAARVAVEEALRAYRTSLAHGRNYQHIVDPSEVQSARNADEREVTNLQRAYNDLQKLTSDILLAAGSEREAV